MISKPSPTYQLILAKSSQHQLEFFKGILWPHIGLSQLKTDFLSILKYHLLFKHHHILRTTLDKHQTSSKILYLLTSFESSIENCLTHELQQYMSIKNINLDPVKSFGNTVLKRQMISNQIPWILSLMQHGRCCHQESRSLGCL